MKKLTPHAATKAIVRFRENADMEYLRLFLSEDERYEGLATAMVDPGFARNSFPTLCKKFGVTPQELQTIYTDGMRHLALLKLSNGLNDIAQDVIDDAKSRFINCGRCDGVGRVWVTSVEETEDGTKEAIKDERDCPSCDGAGKIRESGDKHSRDLIFESMKLTGNKGPLVAIQQNYNANNADDKIEGLLKLTQTITMGDKQQDIE